MPRVTQTHPVSRLYARPPCIPNSGGCDLCRMQMRLKSLLPWTQLTNGTQWDDNKDNCIKMHLSVTAITKLLPKIFRKFHRPDRKYVKINVKRACVMQIKLPALTFFYCCTCNFTSHYHLHHYAINSHA